MQEQKLTDRKYLNYYSCLKGAANNRSPLFSMTECVFNYRITIVFNQHL